jgi:hypothetical protein
MNPHLLTLALTTPLEQLLELPNAVRIAACAREDLQRFSAEQLAQMLARMDTAITDTVALAQSQHGSGLVSRGEQRDLDWLIEASNQTGWPRLKSALAATGRDYFLVLALYKLGEVIDATAGTPPVALVNPVVATLMEALEALMLADLLPDSPTTEQIIEQAWKAGITPDTDAADEVRKAQSHAGRQAADVRHASNRAAKQKALELFASNTYRTKDEAYRIIGAQVCRAPGTVKNWIAGLQKNTPQQ